MFIISIDAVNLEYTINFFNLRYLYVHTQKLIIKELNYVSPSIKLLQSKYFHRPNYIINITLNLYICVL